MSRSSDREGQPWERLRREGSESLAVVELLAVLWRMGSSRKVSLDLAARTMNRFESIERLAAAGDAELLEVCGIGPARLAGLRAAVEIGARLACIVLPSGERLDSPEQVYRCFGPRLRHARQESFFTLLLDSRQRLIREVEVSRGSLNQSLVHPREVFAPALREAAASILILHNHPSGDPDPSPDDHEVTRRLVRAGEILGIRLLDHVVVAAGGFRSFARSGWLSSQGGFLSNR